jgi:N-acetyl-anhydromuramyl-L-alanine amidase AmpD
MGVIFLISFVIFLFFDKGQKRNLSIKKPSKYSNSEKRIILKRDSEDKVVSSNTKTSSKEQNFVVKEKIVNEQERSKSATIKKASKDLESQKKKKVPKIIDSLVNWGFHSVSGRKIDTIIIHSSYNALDSNVHNIRTIINREYKPAGVSPHYIISRNGTIYRLVQDQNVAYHAGVSKMPDGRTGVNNFSLGIEIVETRFESPTKDQYKALKELVVYLKSKYKIKYVLGHSDIAPGRKTDPWNFDWKKLEKEK